jgi:hypothetical protein
MASIGYDKRGYTYTNSNNPYGDDRQPKGDYWNGSGNGRGRRYTFARNYDDPALINDCAMMCDQAGFCKSFTVATDPGTDSSKNGGKGITTCYLNLDKSAGWTQPNNAQWIKNLRNYDKNGQVTAPGENFTAVFDTGGGDHNVDSTATDYCSGRNCCDGRSNPGWQYSTVRLIQGARGGGDNTDKCGTWEGSGSPACKNPGVVTRTTNDNGALVNKVRCGYNRLDTKWTQDNWANLGSFGFDATNLEAAKRAHCNGLTYDELSRDTNQCPSVSGFNKNARLLDMISNTWWTDPNEVSKLQTMAENSKTDPSLIDGVKTKLNKLPTSGVWSQNVIKFVRSLVKNETVYAQDATGISMNYCNNNSGSTECACIKEQLKWSPSRCVNQDCSSTGNILGKAIAESTNNVIKAKLAAAYLPLCHASECQDESVLLPGRPTSTCPSQVTNICSDQTVVGGSVTRSSLQQLCNFDTSVGSQESKVTTSTGTTSTTGTASGGTAGTTTTTDAKGVATSTDSAATTSTNRNYIIATIVFLLVCCCCFLLIGGVAAFTL